MGILLSPHSQHLRNAVHACPTGQAVRLHGMLQASSAISFLRGKWMLCYFLPGKPVLLWLRTAMMAGRSPRLKIIEGRWLSAELRCLCRRRPW